MAIQERHFHFTLTRIRYEVPSFLVHATLGVRA